MLFLTINVDLLIALLDDDLCRCSKCGAALTSTEAVVDAIRVGQEAIDKAIAVQFQGMS